MDKYIDLKRSFIDYSNSTNPEEAAQQSYINSLLGQDSNLYWEQLLESKYIVVLGEAGSGKSWEFNAQNQVLKSNGKFSFFLRLENMVEGSLADAIDPLEENIFQKWLLSNDSATFFLDSVDEAKLKSPDALHSALNHFVKGIGLNAILRINIVISSRISEWRGNTDRSEICQRFAIPNNGEDSAPQLKIVLLAPLTETQLCQMAKAKGINDTDNFIQTIAEHSVMEFTSRPLDAELLIEYWKDNQRIGTRHELLEHSIPIKLLERIERKMYDHLTPNKARSGAETLAAAAILCKKFNILVPDSDIPNNTTSLNIQILLPSWSSLEKSALLSRPIFDGATYGHIRFHHRTTTEYLCACWLQQRMYEQLPYSNLEEILFMSVHDRWMIRPTMAAVSTWLATLANDSWNKRIKKFLLEHSPEIFLQFGEPRDLKTEDLKLLLHSLLAQYKDRRSVQLPTENYQLSALARPDLSDELSAIIQDNSTSDGIRIEIILAIRYGKLAQCNDALLNIINSDSSDYIKRYATRTLSELASQEQLNRLHIIAQQQRELPSMLCAYLCDALYPKIISPTELISLLEKISPLEDKISLDLPYHLEFLIKDNDIPSSHYNDILKGLIRLCKQKPYIQEGNKSLSISMKFGWLGETLIQVLIKILSHKIIDQKTYPQITKTLTLLNAINRTSLFHGANKELLQLNKLLLQHPDIRENYAWSIINQKHTNTHEVHIVDFFGYSDVISADKSDIEWLINNIDHPKSELQQKQALILAIQLHHRVVLPKQTKSRLLKALSKNKALIHLLRNELSSNFVHTYRRVKCKLLDRYFWRHKKYFLHQKFLEIYNFLFDWIWLHSHIRGIRSGKYFHTLNVLAHYSITTKSPPYQKHNWRNLIPKYDRYIAKAAHDGWIIFWRTYKPVLTQKTDAIEVGLAGIRAELTQNPQLINNISNADAELMTRYATHSLDSYPDWLIPLAEIKPQSVQNILNQCIKNEWGHPENDSLYYGTISRLQYAPTIIQDLTIEQLQNSLKKSDPTHPRIVEIVLQILLLNSLSDKSFLVLIAKDRLNSLSPNKISFINWLSLLLQIDGMQGITALKQQLTNPIVNADELMLSLAAQLDPHHGSSKITCSNPSYRCASCLRILIPIVYKYIKVSDDTDRSRGGTYSPNRRDYAQSFRGELLPWLASSNDSNAYQLLTELPNEPILSNQKDFMLQLMDKRAERDSDLMAWLPAQISEFEKEHESQPRSNHDLFKLVCRRFQNIKDHVEKDDYSPRDIFNTSSIEPELRKWLANQLRERANGLYNEVQEIEVDLKKEPDIRIVSPSVHPVSIEIKWADNWTLNDLEEALTSQLAGQYLRTPDSNYGILLLGYRGKKKSWRYKKGYPNLTLVEVEAHIQSLAEKVKEQDTNIFGLKVFSIDFTQPKI